MYSLLNAYWMGSAEAKISIPIGCSRIDCYQQHTKMIFRSTISLQKGNFQSTYFSFYGFTLLVFMALKKYPIVYCFLWFRYSLRKRAPSGWRRSKTTRSRASRRRSSREESRRTSRCAPFLIGWASATSSVSVGFLGIFFDSAFMKIGYVREVHSQ